MDAKTKKILLIGGAAVAAYLIYRQMNKPAMPTQLPAAYIPAGTGPQYTSNAAQIISASVPAVAALSSQISTWFKRPVSVSPTTTSAAYI